jgi:hypothetical protein
MLPTPWRLWIPAAAALLASPLPAQSAHPPLHVDPSVRDCSVRFAPGLTQHAFGRFAREFGSVSAFKQAASPATLGRGRVLFAIQSLSFRIDDRADAWNDTFVHPDAEHTLGARQDLPAAHAARRRDRRPRRGRLLHGEPERELRLGSASTASTGCCGPGRAAP